MTEPKRDESSEQQPDSTTADNATTISDTKPADEEVTALKGRKRVSREEIFDEYGHIPGYSDMQGFSNLALVVTTEEDVDDDEADEVLPEDEKSTKASDTQQHMTTDTASDESA